MKAIGILGIIILIILGIGYVRGWVSGSVTQDERGPGVELNIDADKLEADRQKALDRVDGLSVGSAAAVRAMARELGKGESALEGRLSAIDTRSRELTVSSGDRVLELHVPEAVPIRRAGVLINFNQMSSRETARFVFSHAGEDRLLARVELLR
ncbi:MAG: hypothetical protein JNM84_24430 [Planctomycetes bacterium]|nr:hypothetical protein [Planctomycetota bacterium]